MNHAGATLRQLLNERSCLLFGMIHLKPLPGSPQWGGSMRAVVKEARRDARCLAAAGFDGVIVENFGDAPFVPECLPAATVASLSVCAGEVRQEIAGSALLVGINALRNDAAAALGVAVAVAADLIRINVHVGAMWTDQGLIEGRAHQTLRERRSLGADIAVLADVLVKHGRPPVAVDPAQAARDTVLRGLADGLVVTGTATGHGVDPARLEAVAAGAEGRPVFAGSGVTSEALPRLFAHAQGAIVGTWLKTGSMVDAPIDPDRARQMVTARDALLQRP